MDNHKRIRNVRPVRFGFFDSSNAESHALLGKIEYGRDDLESAAAAFTRAVKLDPDSLPAAWFYLGEIQVTLSNPREARRALRGYLKRWPNGENANDANQLLRSLN